MQSMTLQVLGFEKQTAYDLFWPLAWQTYGIQMEQDCWGFFFCGLHTNSLAEAASKAKSRKLAKRRACSVLQHGWFKRKAATNREAELESLNFSKLIRYVETL